MDGHFQQQLGHKVAGLRAEHGQWLAAGGMLRIEQQGIGHDAGETIAQPLNAGFDGGDTLHGLLLLLLGESVFAGPQCGQLTGQAGPLL